MNCKVCQTQLVQDSFGLFCPNENCGSIDGEYKYTEEHKTRITNRRCYACNKVIPLQWLARAVMPVAQQAWAKKTGLLVDSKIGDICQDCLVSQELTRKFVSDVCEI